jgi:hypothetical protein
VVGAAPDHARLIQELVIAPLTRPQLKALGASAAAIVERIAQRNNAPTDRE